MKKVLSVFLVLGFIIYSNQCYAYALGSMDEFNQSALNVIQMTKKMSSENTVKVKPGEVKTLTFSKETSKITSQLSTIDDEINKMCKLMENNKVSEKELNLFCDLIDKNMSDAFHMYTVVNDLNEYVYTKDFNKSTKTKVASFVNKYHEAFKSVEKVQITKENSPRGAMAIVVVCAIIAVAIIINGVLTYADKKICKPKSDQDHANGHAWQDIGDETGIYNPHPNNPYNSDFPANTHDTTQHPNQNNHNSSHSSHGTNETHTGTHEVITVPTQTGK